MAEAYIVEAVRGDYEREVYTLAVFTERAAADEFAAVAKRQSAAVHAEIDELSDAWHEEQARGEEDGPAAAAFFARSGLADSRTAIDPQHYWSGGDETAYSVVPVPLNPSPEEVPHAQ